MLCFLIGDVQSVNVKFRSRPKGATRSILPNDCILSVSGQSISNPFDLSLEVNNNFSDTWTEASVKDAKYFENIPIRTTAYVRQQKEKFNTRDISINAGILDLSTFRVLQRWMGAGDFFFTVSRT